MTDTTDTARLARELRHKAGMRSKPPSPMAAGVPFFVYDEDTRVLLSHAADALERLAAENAELRKDAARIDAITDNAWTVECYNVPTGGGDFQEEWRVLLYEFDGSATAVASGYTPRRAIDAAMAEGKGDDV